MVQAQANEIIVLARRVGDSRWKSLSATVVARQQCLSGLCPSLNTSVLVNTLTTVLALPRNISVLG